MKNILKPALLLVFFICTNIFSQNNNQDREKRVLELVLKTLQESHYKNVIIDDEFSKKIFSNYLDAVDPQKVYFLESDFLEFKKIETKLDDQIKNNDLSFFYLTYERVIKRMIEAKAIYTDLSKSIFKIDLKENINIDQKTYKFCKNETELKNRFRTIYKYEIVNKIYQKEKAGTLKTIPELEKESREEILNLTNSTNANYKNFKRIDCFEFYISAIVKSLDENSSYLSVYNKDKFDVNLGGRLVGVGNNIELQSGFVTIKKIAYNSPSYKSKQIEVGDIVLKIGQENDEPIDIVGFDIAQATKLMRGKIGTSVKLTLKKPDGTILEVKLKRDIIDINDTDSKSSIVEKNGKKYGVINIPVFYNDLEKDTSRDAAKDVATEIISLKKEGVDGLLLDLRNNNSDSLETAFTICGYFLGNNPITQIRNKDNSVGLLKSEDAKLIWEGPLVLLLNENSSRTTEVFAAAIQDYKRGVIVGNVNSKGEGTLLKSIDLSPQINKENKDHLGITKIATQKFYRLNGNSFDQNGVNSDVFLTNLNNSSINKYVSDKINQIIWSQFNFIKNFDEVLINSKSRISNNKTFKLINEFYALKNNFLQQKIYSLNYKTFKSQENQNLEKTKKFEILKDYNNKLSFRLSVDELNKLKKNEVLLEKRNQWLENLTKDMYVEEAINVLSEIKGE